MTAPRKRGINFNRRAFITLVSNADYCLGATALAKSILRSNPGVPIVVMATSDEIPLDSLASLGCDVRIVSRLHLSEDFKKRHSRDQQHQVAPFTKGNKPSFHDPLDNFCKLRLWEFEEFDAVVFVDADAIVVKDISKLFDYPEFSAAPNLYETLADMHRLNSGVFVAKPRRQTFESMCEVLEEPNRFWRRTDQTFLEHYFPDWHGLPYTFNALQYIFFNLPELWRWDAIRVVHYQYEKPWEKAHPKYELLKPLIDLWFSVLEDGDIPDEITPLTCVSS